jgi:hypothetical protein
MGYKTSITSRLKKNNVITKKSATKRSIPEPQRGEMIFNKKFLRGVQKKEDRKMRKMGR